MSPPTWRRRPSKGTGRRKRDTCGYSPNEARAAIEALRETSTRLDELMPEPLADVLERQDQQRARVAAELRRFTRRTQT